MNNGDIPRIDSYSKGNQTKHYTYYQTAGVVVLSISRISSEHLVSKVCIAGKI